MNDNFCYICKKAVSTSLHGGKKKAAASKEDGNTIKKSEVSAMDDIVLCDGCSNSAHFSCLGLSTLPLEDESDLWFCTDCDPNSATATCYEAARRAAVQSPLAVSSRVKAMGGNVDICYVCQKSGKLLGCDFCEQAFHPKCIDTEFLEFEPTTAADSSSSPPQMIIEADKWRCPICKGEDPLKNMGHKRMSRTAMLKLQREWQDCIRTTYLRCKLNRDKFLWSTKDAILPFITPKALTRLNKLFGTAGKKKLAGRRRGRRLAIVGGDDDSDATLSENEEDDDEVEEDSLVISVEESKLKRTSLQAYRAAQKLTSPESNTFLKDGVQLKGYQIIGVGWLLNAFYNKAGAILADEMGLGKTIQCLAFLSALKASSITGPHLIVVPLSTVGNWAREIRKFVPHLKFVKICGSRFEREHTMTDPAAAQGIYDLYITTYETVVTEEAFFCDNISWQCLILDEAHRIKNESGRIRHSLDRVSANMRVLLTGTPLQNNVKELFTLLNFLFPDVLKDSENFEKVFQPTESDIDSTIIKAVTQLLSKMMLRRTKDLVVKLPKKFEQDIWVPLSPTAAYWYKALLDVSESAFQQQSVKKLLGAVVKMRVCCCHPRGLVTRDSQLKRFKEVFWCLDREEEITLAASKLLKMTGEQHILASSKLTVLDKILSQLHLQNIKVSDQYSKDFVQNVKDLYIQQHTINEATLSTYYGSTNQSDDTLATLPVPTPPPTNSSPRESSTSPLGLTTFSPSADIGSPNPPGSPTPLSGGLETAEVVTKTAQMKRVATRQNNERIKREKAAALAQHHLELERALLKLEDDCLVRLKPSAEDVTLFEKWMWPANIDRQKIEQSENEDDEGGCVTEDEEKSSDDIHGDPIPNKILIFTQFQLILDELEGYCRFRGFRYLRLDGSTNKMIRELDIREFNGPSSTHLVYLICTRAGGVGINLVTANHVVLYDEDWNPFIDLQAIDRAHRIGQNRYVHVWKLITEWTVEERMAFRRMQKLKLDKLLIQAEQQNEDDTCEPDAVSAAAEKFSLEELKRLIRHGRKAIENIVQNKDEHLDREKLETLLARTRKTLPIIDPEDEETEISFNENPEEKVAEVAESDLINAPNIESGSNLISSSSAQGENTTSADEGCDRDENNIEEEDSASALKRANRRSRRARQQPNILQVPSALPEVKVKVERKIIYDKRCFKCGSGNGTEPPEDPLVQCHRCPKVYHQIACLGFTEMPKKTWTCHWHECCLCFRKGSQAGGMLIHCAECPTTFCFDCFPPEYRRYHPPATYYTELCKRGYTTATPEKLVLFLCSRCKALKEQERRRLLSKQQLEAEAKKRREINLKARIDAHKAKNETDNAETRKEFQTRKKRIDDQDKIFNKAIRTGYERLYPQEFIELLKEKKTSQLAHKDQLQNIVKPENTQTDDLDEHKSAGKALEASSDLVVGEKTTKLESKSDTVDEPVAAKTTKVTVVKMPSEFCRLCENCHLPAHEANLCPYPSETEKKNVAVDTDSAKRLIRSFCPKCGVTSRNHFRRHCDRLTANELQEYDERREKIKEFIAILEKAETLQDEALCESMTVATIESCRRVLQKKADDIVVKCLISVAMENCVAKTSHGNQHTSSMNATAGQNTNTKNKRRKRLDSAASIFSQTEAAGGLESDDDSYVSSSSYGGGYIPQNPRKKTKSTEESQAPSDRRRRAAVMNRSVSIAVAHQDMDEEEEQEEDSHIEVDITSQDDLISNPSPELGPVEVIKRRKSEFRPPPHQQPMVYSPASYPQVDNRFPPSRWHNVMAPPQRPHMYQWPYPTQPGPPNRMSFMPPPFAAAWQQMAPPPQMPPAYVDAWRMHYATAYRTHLQPQMQHPHPNNPKLPHQPPPHI